MKIHNLRLGHATNSSSSHSIVIAPPNYKNMPHTKYFYPVTLNFGWEQFILADPEAKLPYFAAQMYGSLTSIVTYDIAAAVIRDWFGIDVGNISDKYGPEVGVDHESVLHFPVDALTTDFADQLFTFISDDRFSVYGGNYNDGQMDIPNECNEIAFF